MLKRNSITFRNYHLQKKITDKKEKMEKLPSSNQNISSFAKDSNNDNKQNLLNKHSINENENEYTPDSNERNKIHHVHSETSLKQQNSPTLRFNSIPEKGILNQKKNQDRNVPSRVKFSKSVVIKKNGDGKFEEEKLLFKKDDLNMFYPDSDIDKSINNEPSEVLEVE